MKMSQLLTYNEQHRKYDKQLETTRTVLVDGVDGLQHVLPVELPLKRVDGFAVSQPGVQIQVAALHQHVDIAVGYFTAKKKKSGTIKISAKQAKGGWI